MPIQPYDCTRGASLQFTVQGSGRLSGRQWRVLKIVGKRYYNIDFGGLIAHISDW